MATLRQKKLAKLIVENALSEKPLNAGQMLESVGYSKTMATAKPGEMLASKGVKKELEILGFTEEAAMSVVSEILNNKNVDPNARLKAADQVFKVRGTYAPEKSLVAHIQVSEAKREKSNGLFDSILGN